MAASAPTLGAAVIVIALYDIEAADRDLFLDLVRTDIEITRGKPGCLWYSLAEDIVEDNVFRLSEGWATREDLEAHFVSEPFQPFAWSSPLLRHRRPRRATARVRRRGDAHRQRDDRALRELTEQTN